MTITGAIKKTFDRVFGYGHGTQVLYDKWNLLRIY